MPTYTCLSKPVHECIASTLLISLTNDYTTTADFFFYYKSICIIDNGASRHRTRNARFRVRRADHSTTSILQLLIWYFFTHTNI